MILFDNVEVPLDDGSYQLTVETSVSGQDPTGQSFGPPTMSQSAYFDVVGPRFSVPASMVAGTFPPKNKAGPFSNSLPQIVLSRRSLPWERALDPQSRLPPPQPTNPPLTGPTPWVSLLLFEDDEAALMHNVPLESVLPPQALSDIAAPSGVTCDAVAFSSDLLPQIMPSLNELQLLCHVRLVNVENREISTASGDGYFAVVVSNRLPSPGAQCTAVLVSLEGRTDVVLVEPPATTPAQPPGDEAAAASPPLAPVPRTYATTGKAIPVAKARTRAVSGAAGSQASASPVTLVALASWQFTCSGEQSFMYLMQHLDVSMLGTAPVSGHPPVTDTGHIPITLQDRLGATEQVLYRGPLVPYSLTRDNLGPYHSADQARRVTPETGTEDISYAAAFEIGRLLAAADPRLAQALMSWRREAYKQASRQSTISALAATINLDLPATSDEQLHSPVVPEVAVSSVQAVVASNLSVADVYGLGTVASSPGLQAAQLAPAWGITTAEADALLGDAGTLGVVAPAPALSARGDTSLADVAADTAGLARLSAARAQVEKDATQMLEAHGA
jgi:hypothetical protein